jgi:hypothetical protein
VTQTRLYEEMLIATTVVITGHELPDGKEMRARMLKKAVQQGRSEVHGAKVDH